MSEKLYQDKDWLHEQYWIHGKSTTDMAKAARCSSSTIATWMEKFDIPRRTRVEGASRKGRDPERLRKLTEAFRHRSQNPEWLRKVTEARRRRARNPKWRKRHAEAIRRVTQTPEWRKKQAEGVRRRFQDPEYRRKYVVRMQKLNLLLALKKRGLGEMTKIESICHAALETLTLEFVFQKPIKGYIVDFFFPSHNIILEAMGDYWHNLPERHQEDTIRKQLLVACGYTVLEWWEKDIKADVYKLIDEELLPLLDQPSRMERPPRGVSKPYKGPHGWKSATQLYLFGKEPDDRLP